MSSKCPRCKKTVYDAECVQGAGRKWHSQCFRCLECGSGLSSTTIAEKDGEIYCANDYAKLFGPKGFGIGGLNTVTGISVSDDSKSTSTPRLNCVSCGARGQSGKFCGECGGSLSATSFSQPANTTYNRPPSPRATGKPPTVKSVPSSSAAALGGGPKINEKCGVCGETAYFAESVNAAGRTFHSECFKCFSCRTGLNSQTLSENDSKIYCNACYSKLFGPKGYGFAGGAATTFSVTK